MTLSIKEFIIVAVKITDEQLDNLCEISKLSFLGDEREEVKKRLAVLTDMLDELTLLDGDSTEKAERVLSTVNVLRTDDVTASTSRNELLKNAPITDGVYFVVPKVVE